MSRVTTAALILLGGLMAGPVSSQTRPNPTQQTATIRQDDVPLFRAIVVERTSPAINYRPRKGSTEIDFAGTVLLPRAHGSATVEGKKGYFEIDAKFDDLDPAQRFGREYLTYVLWAITAEGRPTNLGELQVDGDDGKLEVTTELQAFGLIVTAEPYFAVTHPSDVVVMENVVRQGGIFRDGTTGKVEFIQAKYELLKRGTYLINQDASRLRVKALEPGAPLDLAEARNAVELARLAGADRYASDSFAKASQLLADAELARKRRRGGNALMMPSRHAVQTAEDARLIALQRQEEAYLAEQRATMQRRESEALELARSEETRRQQAELDKLRADEQKESAERDRLLAEAARASAERDKQLADVAKFSAERDRVAAEAARATAEQDKQLADAAKAAAERERADAEAARAAAESARLTAESQAQQAITAAAQADREKVELRERLRQQLNLILETQDTARGLIVNVSDVLFDTASANLKPGARERLARISGVLLAHPGLKIDVDGHTDSLGSDGYNQRLSERRAESVRGYLVQQGIPPNALKAAGFGENQPVVSNTTATGRQQNRRVELVVSGAPIAIALTSSASSK